MDAKGNLICSATPLPAPVNVADRDYFLQSMSTGKPAGGELTIGRVTSRPAVIMSSPILNAAGQPIGLSAASLDLSSVVRLPAALELPESSSVTLLDRAGVVMARNVDAEQWIGKPGPERSFVSNATTSSVSAAGSATERESHTGMPPARKDAMWNTGRSGTCVMLNGITDGAWLCTTAITSGRAL